jgi:NADH:ubiquinone reductase (H+-translocating)
MGIRLKGFIAWAIARGYHLAWMPGLDRKSRLIADWSVEILFPRDLADMGQLGHPDPLSEQLSNDQSVNPGHADDASLSSASDPSDHGVRNG